MREWAAGAVAKILLRDFFDFIESVNEEWVEHPSENIRRAVAVAIKYVSKAKKEEYADSMFSLTEKLMTDDSRYVRKNVGPFALGDGLLRYCPERVLQKIEEWRQSDNGNVKWNVIKLFSTAEARKYKEIAEPIVRAYGHDPDYKIRQAANSTLKTLLG
ncbi:hypothetical protein M3202_08280 [Alkalihalobacillus oceani]|uniref:DNA alkylation repair enzyme n=1 Tax=Halalkalibacter oceani TaxID=1653776 RepID=A0A9X2IPZ6_9BACI|nr:hypothetical protein [Halalkalibacter oceani]